MNYPSLNTAFYIIWYDMNMRGLGSFGVHWKADSPAYCTSKFLKNEKKHQH